MRVAEDDFVSPFDDAFDRRTNFVGFVIRDDVAADFRHRRHLLAVFEFGTEGGTRTPKPVKATDFESVVSTSSTTSATGGEY